MEAESLNVSGQTHPTQANQNSVSFRKLHHPYFCLNTFPFLIKIKNVQNFLFWETLLQYRRAAILQQGLRFSSRRFTETVLQHGVFLLFKRKPYKHLISQTRPVGAPSRPRQRGQRCTAHRKPPSAACPPRARRSRIVPISPATECASMESLV